jgi:hypothetical protein
MKQAAFDQDNAKESNIMRSNLTLLGTALFLVAAVHADSGSEFSATCSFAQLETSSLKANQVLFAQPNSKTKSPSGQQDNSDDCN